MTNEISPHKYGKSYNGQTGRNEDEVKLAEADRLLLPPGGFASGLDISHFQQDFGDTSKTSRLKESQRVFFQPCVLSGTTLTITETLLTK